MFAEVDQARELLRSVVSALEPGCLDGRDAVRLLELFGECERLGAAGKTLVARRADESNVWKREGHRSGAHWLASRTGVSVGQAIGTLETSQRLDALPATAQAFKAGKLSDVAAREVTEAATADPGAEDQLLHTARRAGLKGLRERCRAVKAAATSAAEEIARHERMRRARSFCQWTDRDGMGRVSLRITPDNLATVVATMRPFRARVFKEAREAGRRESWEAYDADAFMAMVDAAGHGGDATPSGPKATIHFRVDHSAFVRGHTVPGETCDVPGVGPVPVATVRAMASDAILFGIVTRGVDVTTVAHLGRTIDAPLRTAIHARQHECGVEGCHVREHLEIDHKRPIAEGGETSLENTWLVCKWHHYVKTHLGYRIAEAETPGAWRLVAPDDPDPP